MTSRNGAHDEDCDMLVIGSGLGGRVAALQLTKKAVYAGPIVTKIEAGQLDLEGEEGHRIAARVSEMRRLGDFATYVTNGIVVGWKVRPWNLVIGVEPAAPQAR